MSKYLKQLITDQLSSELEGVTECVLVNVIGLSANETVDLRKQLREKDIRIRVVKNSMVMRAVEGTALAPAFEGANGTLAVCYGGEDFITLVKEVHRHQKDEDNFEQFVAKGGVMDGETLTPEMVAEVSKWPSREEQLSILVGQLLGPGRTLLAQLESGGANLAAQIDQIDGSNSPAEEEASDDSDAEAEAPAEEEASGESEEVAAEEADTAETSDEAPEETSEEASSDDDDGVDDEVEAEAPAEEVVEEIAEEASDESEEEPATEESVDEESDKVEESAKVTQENTTHDVGDEEDVTGTMQWYILKVQVNREDSIRDALVRRIKMHGLEEFFGDVVVPTEDIAEFNRSGKRRIVKKKLFPGYIMVNMIINDDTWFLVRETSGIGDFTGTFGKPTPMSDEEVRRIIQVDDEVEEGEQQVKTAIPFKKGDRVRVKDGNFQNFEGEVDNIDEASGRVTIIVSIFGRSTPVELEHWQIEEV